MMRCCFPVFSLLFAVLLSSCAGHEHYFQPDARVGPAPGGAPDSALVTVGRHYAAHGRVFRWFWGAHYRTVWAAPVVLPVLRLAALPNQPQPTELGGGFQTTSVTLETPQGRKLVARTLDKDPYRTLPKIARKTFLLRLVRDETSAANPFAPLALPALSQAAGVPHTTPRLYYIPTTDSAFAPLTPKLRGKVVLLEEKFDGEKMAPATGVANARDVIDSDDALRKRFRTPEVAFDGVAFARARLFDLWIGDWDRHHGQWAWAVAGTAEMPRYFPVPKDRDQAFFRFDDGLLPWLASRRWAVRKLRTMHAHYDDVAGLALNARFIDTRVLATVTAPQFDSLARHLQQHLTDSVIALALAAWPPAIRALEAERTATILRARRDALPAAARKFYATLAAEPLVVGTDEKELFRLEYAPDGAVTIEVTTETGSEGNSDGPAGPLAARRVFRRTYSPTETRQIRVYGLGGDDTFVVAGTAGRHTICVTISGGEGEDELTTPTPGTVVRRLTVRDSKRGLVLPENAVPGLRTRLAKRGDVRVHDFDREGL